MSRERTYVFKAHVLNITEAVRTELTKDFMTPPRAQVSHLPCPQLPAGALTAKGLSSPTVFVLKEEMGASSPLCF